MKVRAWPKPDFSLAISNPIPYRYITIQSHLSRGRVGILYSLQLKLKCLYFEYQIHKYQNVSY